MNQYIGIDISKATLDCFDGRNSYRLPNTPEGFKQIRHRIPKGKTPCFIFEPTGVYSHALMEFCQQHKIEALIVGSKEAREYARSIKQRSKTDRIDAKVLYRYHSQIGVKENIAPCVPRLDPVMKKITQRRNIHLHYTAMIQKMKNLLESLDPRDKILRLELTQEIKHLQKKADRLFEEIEKLLIPLEENKTHLKNLQTIPGIGRKSALLILLELARYPKASARKMTALMGLDPVLKESGQFKGKVRLSKKGGYHFRTGIYMATVVAVHHNPHLKAFFERLVHRGKPKMLALLAAMRKLLVLAMAIVRTQTPYQVEFGKN